MKYTKNALLVFVLLAFFYGYFFHDPSANGNSRIGLILAIVQQHRLIIDSYFNNEGTRTSDIAFYNGHYYSDKAIGTSLIGSIFYAPMYYAMKFSGYQLDLRDVKYILTFLVISLPSAFAGSLVYIFSETITKSRLRSYLITLAINLGTMVLAYSAVYFGHQLAGALLFTSFFLIFQLKLKPALRNNFIYLFLIGFLLAMAFITEYPTFVIILPLSLYYVYNLRDKWSFRWLRKSILPALAGGLIPIVILLVYNKLCFGNPFSIGYQYLDNQYKVPMSQGLLGIGIPRLDVLFYLTFHPAEGLFIQSPVLLMAVLGFFYLWRDKRYRIEGLLSLLAFISILLINSGYFVWWGGGTFGPRHLVPMLLFLSLPLSLLPKRLAPIVLILSIISIGQMLIPLADNMLVLDQYFTNGGFHQLFGYSTIYNYCLQQLLQGQFTYNIGEKLLGLHNWMIMLPIFVVIIAITVVVFLNEKRLKQNTSPKAS